MIHLEVLKPWIYFAKDALSIEFFYIKSRSIRKGSADEIMNRCFFFTEDRLSISLDPFLILVNEDITKAKHRIGDDVIMALLVAHESLALLDDFDMDEGRKVFRYFRRIFGKIRSDVGNPIIPMGNGRKDSVIDILHVR